MVRVVSVHHFAGQSVRTAEQPTAAAVAPPSRLLLALPSHRVEVRDLRDDGEVTHSFPTVDEVTQIAHCSNGDYVLTLESKFNRQNRDVGFVRVYVNWDGVATMQQSKMTSGGVSLGASECGMVQPMRARIAGRVTPTTNQSELGNLEMIEVPTRRNPLAVDCCQISGNILILANKSLVIYGFRIKIHDISKLRFVDFEEMPLGIELSFRPTQISICENYIACINNSTMHMFRIVGGSAGTTGESNGDFSFAYDRKDEPIDYKELLKNETLNVSKEKVTVTLPSVVRENSVVHKYSPFTFCDREPTAAIKPETDRYEIENLVQTKMVPVLIENARGQVIEEFKCVVVKPLYVEREPAVSKSKKNILRSDQGHLLHSVVCMIATQQEGYLYQFCDSEIAVDTDSCVAVYPFTAPVHQLVMEDHLLHALTEVGLETYTLRIGHQLCRKLEVVDDVNTACPSISDAVCLVGLRPFLGVEKMLLSDNHLVLLANGDGSPTHSVGSNSSSTTSSWTIYALELPTPKAIFNDISIVASVHRFTSAQTYRHLMSEAHMILRTSLLLVKWTAVEGNVTVVAPLKRNLEDVVETYRTSCALLADHYILCYNESDYTLALPYYKMASVPPRDVMKRVKKVQEQANSTNSRGLLYYLRSVLLEVKYYEDADKLFGTASKQNFVDGVLELFQSHRFDDLPKLILKSAVLREYSVDKLIGILEKKVSNDATEIAEKSLALAVLHIQRCNTKKACDVLVNIDGCQLRLLLSDNRELLFDSCRSRKSKSGNLSFSELCVALFGVSPELVSELFVDFISENKTVTLNRILRAFLDYLPASIGADCSVAGTVLQKTLESYFLRSFRETDPTKTALDRAPNEALKILVRSYLSQLQMLQMKEKNCRFASEKAREDRLQEDSDTEDKDRQQEKFKYNRVNKTYFEEANARNKSETYLFSEYRLEYLDKMPPFQVEISKRLYETCSENCTVTEQRLPSEEADFVLKKLQALLCSQILPKQMMAEVKVFLSLDENLRGIDSLRSIMMNVNDAVLFLVDSCPQCLLQYGKDRFTKTDEWKFLVATIQQKILRLSQETDLKRVCFFYKKILKDVLTHVATTMKLEQLLQVFPQNLAPTESEENHSCDVLDEIQNYEPYLLMCKETMHANQIKRLISATGQQLLCTLNL